MTPRMNYHKAAPEVMTAMMAAEAMAQDLSLPEALRELINIRVSQINGCAFCLHLHAPAARQAGVSRQMLDVLAAWRESPLFDERERAALAWAEALTRIAPTGVPDPDYARLVASFDERERVELTFVIALVNAWNRFAVGFRPALSGGNLAKTMSAPVCVIIAHDPSFYDHLPQLFPHADARPWFTTTPGVAEETDLRNGTLMGSYLIMAARALGLDAGPMSGFDAGRVEEAFLAGTGWKANFLCNLGYGDPDALFGRLPRLEFDQACRLA